MLSGGENVYAEPYFGVTENPSSAMAPSNAAQLIEPRASDLLNSVENTWLAGWLTLKTCVD